MIAEVGDDGPGLRAGVATSAVSDRIAIAVISTGNQNAAVAERGTGMRSACRIHSRRGNEAFAG